MAKRSHYWLIAVLALISLRLSADTMIQETSYYTYKQVNKEKKGFNNNQTEEVILGNDCHLHKTEEL